jgi:hypothetical protein
MHVPSGIHNHAVICCGICQTPIHRPLAWAVRRIKTTAATCILFMDCRKSGGAAASLSGRANGTWAG